MYPRQWIDTQHRFLISCSFCNQPIETKYDSVHSKKQQSTCTHSMLNHDLTQFLAEGNHKKALRFNIHYSLTIFLPSSLFIYFFVEIFSKYFKKLNILTNDQKGIFRGLLKTWYYHWYKILWVKSITGTLCCHKFWEEAIIILAAGRNIEKGAKLIKVSSILVFYRLDVRNFIYTFKCCPNIASIHCL